jgi:beta-galactosidase
MKKNIFIILFLSTFMTINAQRKLETINEYWRFERSDSNAAQDTAFNDQNWEVINLPHTWNAVDAMKPNYYQGIGWYRKRLTTTINDDKKYCLYFEGALQDVYVYVNGKQAGRHQGGYSAFRFDITTLLNKGKNVVNHIAVKVDNTLNPSIAPVAFSADFNFWGGIYRDVYLEEFNQVHFRADNYGSKGIFIETPEVSNEAASVKIRGEIKNEGTKTLSVKIKNTIVDANGKTVKEIISKLKAEPGKNISFTALSGKINAPQLWSPDSPYLYRVKTELLDEKTGAVLDAVDNPLGFRWYSVDTKNGFVLNGKPLKLIGACRHQDYEGLGNALSNDLSRYDIELIKNMGANYIRISHYPQDPSVLEACDKLGLLVWEEIPIVNAITPTEEFYENSRINLKEMIRQHYNHPAVVIWAYSNEVLISGYSDELGILHKELDEICRTEDPNRLTSMAFHASQAYNKNGLGDLPNIVAWNRYDGWYYGKTNDFGKFLDKENVKYPNRPLIISEYGCGSDTRLHSLSPEPYDFSMEYQQLFHASYLKQIMERPFVIGSSIWNFIDFGVSKRSESMPGINNKGIVRYNRQPKDIYYFYQAALVKTPVLHIASRDWLNRIGTVASTTENFVKQQVKVFSNLSEMELFVNGKSIGKQRVVDYTAIFDVPFQDGKNLLEVVSGNQKDVLTVNFEVQPYDLRTSKDKNLVIAVNAGSKAYFSDPDNRVIYQPDQIYREGSWGNIGIDLNSQIRSDVNSTASINATNIDPLFQTSRFGMNAYKFDVPDGRYEIDLHFCETQETAPNKRVFNVSIGDKEVLSAFDLYAQYSERTAIIKTYTIEVKDGKGIKIGFTPIVGNPIISGIKLTQLN